MSIEIDVKNYDNTKVVSIKGRIDANTTQDIEEKIEVLLAEEKYNLVADMSGVSFVASAGLRVFLSTLKKTKSCSGNFKLVGLTEDVRKVFDMTGFTNLFEIHSSIEEAISSF